MRDDRLKGRCGVCQQPVHMRDDGTLCRHGRIGPQQAPCPGSGERPVAVVPAASGLLPCLACRHPARGHRRRAHAERADEPRACCVKNCRCRNLILEAPMSDALELPDDLAGALEEVARLRSLLPPEPGPGQLWRVGTKNPQNLYIHEGNDPVGRPAGQMPSPALAELVCRAVNAYQQPGGGR